MIDVTLAGRTFSLALRYPGTAPYFPKADPAALSVVGAPVCLGDEDWNDYLRSGMGACAHTEFSLLTAACSDALMAHDCFILHAVALHWQARSYLIAGRSGVGKSTQIRFLRELRPGEFGVICGDRPIVQLCHSERSAAESKNPSSSVPQSLPPGGKVAPQGTDEGTILVHPSPWNGKENWFGAPAAPLAGIILLERGDGNRLASLQPREAAIPVYSQVIQIGRKPETIRKAADLVTRLLQSVPIWRLTTCQVPDSTRLLLESVFQ